MGRSKAKFKNPAGVKSSKFQFAKGYRKYNPVATMSARNDKWENVGPKSRASKSASLAGRQRGQAYNEKWHSSIDRKTSFKETQARGFAANRRTGTRWERQSGVGFHRNTKMAVNNYKGGLLGAQRYLNRKARSGISGKQAGAVGAVAIGVGAGAYAFHRRADIKRAVHNFHSSHMGHRA